MDISDDLSISESVYEVKFMTDPVIYDKYIEYRKQFVLYNWSKSKWYMQILFMLVATIEIFANGLAKSKNRVDCFNLIGLLLLTEIMYQIKHIDFITKYSGHILIIVLSIHF